MAKRFGAYRFTPGRRKALRKAQLVSARKRKGRGLSRGAKVGILAAGAVALTGSAAYARHKLSGSTFHGGIYGITVPTPTTKMVGVELNVGSGTGFTYNNYGKEGMALSFKLRRKGRDKTWLYRHTPLTMEAVKAAFGKKAGPEPSKVTQWKPPQANPSTPDAGLYEWANRVALTQEVKQKRKAATRGKIISPDGKTTSYPVARVMASERTIDGEEVWRRRWKYLNGMKAAGKKFNMEHIIMVDNLIRREKR